VILLLIALVVGALGAVLVRRSFPQLEGEVRVPGLRQPVDVYRDERGVPHIYASTDDDLFFAQGYVHAQDRFWQMDFWRHVGAGRLSELLGSSQIETDKFLRTLGWERIAELEWEMADEKTKAVLTAYAEGVNAYLAEREGAELSFEYAILKLFNWNYTPEPWTPINTLTWAKVIAWDLRQNLDRELDRALLSADLTGEELADLYPPYPPDHPRIVPGTGIYGPVASTDPIRDARPLLASVADRVAGLDQLVGHVRGAELGSNNWVVAGTRTDSGLPILANDPHLDIQMPSIWYQVGLHCTTVGLACGFDTVGFSFPGTPGVIIGHNDRIAWGVTNAGYDVMDLFIERINPDNPNQYLFEGEWQDMEIRTEIIEAPGKDPIELIVRSTRHGPIISDTYEPLEDFEHRAGVAVPEQFAISLSWTALQPTGLVQSIIGLQKAQNWAEFRDALSTFGVPGQNFVYADVDGNIGYQSTGLVPIRAGGDGSLPASGETGESEWTGFVPFDELPRSFNPPQGYIVTANNLPAGASYPYRLSDGWAYGYRAQRIVDMLEAADEPITVGFMHQMQRDARDLFAEVLVPYVLDLVPSSDLARQGQAVLAQWGDAGDEPSARTYQMSPGEPGAAIYAAVWKNLLQLSVGDELGGEFPPEGGSRWFAVMTDLLSQPDHPWWDNRFTEDQEDRDAILEQSLERAMAELSETLGGDPMSWRWGDLHQATFENQSLGQSGILPIEWILNRGPFEAGGSTSVPNATSWDASEGFDVLALPSMRMVVDFSDFDASTWIHTTGQSGHAFHPNYIDQAEDWAATETYPMLWTRARVEAAAVNHLKLRPER
jgi:penicillin amidase